MNVPKFTAGILQPAVYLLNIYSEKYLHQRKFRPPGTDNSKQGGKTFVLTDKRHLDLPVLDRTLHGGIKS